MGEESSNFNHLQRRRASEGLSIIWMQWVIWYDATCNRKSVDQGRKRKKGLKRISLVEKRILQHQGVSRRYQDLEYSQAFLLPIASNRRFGNLHISAACEAILGGKVGCIEFGIWYFRDSLC